MAVQWNAEISVPKLPGYQHAHDLFGAFVKLPHELHINLDHIDYSGAAETTDSEAAEQRIQSRRTIPEKHRTPVMKTICQCGSAF